MSELRIRLRVPIALFLWRLSDYCFQVSTRFTVWGIAVSDFFSRASTWFSELGCDVLTGAPAPPASRGDVTIGADPLQRAVAPAPLGGSPILQGGLSNETPMGSADVFPGDEDQVMVEKPVRH